MKEKVSKATTAAVEPSDVSGDQQASVITTGECISCGVNATTAMSVAQIFEGQILYFYTNILGITAGMASWISLIAQLWDTINDPLIGHITDNRVFKNGEKVRPLIKWFVPLYVIFGILMFAAPDLSIWLKFAYALIVRILYDVFATLIEIPMYTLRVLQSPLDKDRVRLNQYYTVGGVIGIGIGNILFVPLVLMIGGSDGAGDIANPEIGFLGAVAIFYVLFGITMYWYHAKARERVVPRHEGSQYRKDSLWKTLKTLATSKHWVTLVVFRWFNSLCSTTIIATLMYYSRYVMGDVSWMSYSMMAFLAGGLVSVPIAKPIAKKFSVKAVVLVSGAVFIISKLIFLPAPTNAILFMINAFLTGMGVSFSNVVLGVYDAYVGDIVEIKFEKRIDNMIFTLGSLVRKGGRALVVFGIAQALELSGYSGELAVQSDQTINMLIAMLGIIPLVASIIYTLIGAFFNVERDAKRIRAEAAAAATTE